MNHAFDIDDAKTYGLAEAVLLSNFQFWIAKNKANQRHFYDGRTWTYNSIKAMEELFPYMTNGQIRRTVESLVQLGVLVRGNYNQSPYDRTTWFAFSDEYLDKLELAKANLPFGKSAKSTNTDINTDIPPDPKGACAKSFCQFWDAWPTSERKQDKAKCLAKWQKNKFGACLDAILTDIELKKKTTKWIDGFMEAPLVYLNGKRWEDGSATGQQAKSLPHGKFI